MHKIFAQEYAFVNSELFYVKMVRDYEKHYFHRCCMQSKFKKVSECGVNINLIKTVYFAMNHSNLLWKSVSLYILFGLKY